MASQPPARQSLSKKDPNETILDELSRVEANRYCADCGTKGTRWASWNIGVFLCVYCAGVHRNMGVHISKIKSLTLDKWTDEQLASIGRWGNARTAKITEAHLPKGFKRPKSFDPLNLERFIRNKYEHKRFMASKEEGASILDVYDAAEAARVVPVCSSSPAKPTVTTPIQGRIRVRAKPQSSFSSTITTVPDATQPSIPTSVATVAQSTASPPSVDLFGAATSSPPSVDLFGAATSSLASVDLFGAATSSAPSVDLFGAATSSAPSVDLFGAAISSAPSVDLFGAATSSAPSVDLFSAATSSAPSVDLFGAATSSAQSVDLFGAATTAPPPSDQALSMVATTGNTSQPFCEAAGRAPGGNLIGEEDIPSVHPAANSKNSILNLYGNSYTPSSQLVAHRGSSGRRGMVQRPAAVAYQNQPMYPAQVGMVSGPAGMGQQPSSIDLMQSGIAGMSVSGGAAHYGMPTMAVQQQQAQPQFTHPTMQPPHRPPGGSSGSYPPMWS